MPPSTTLNRRAWLRLGTLGALAPWIARKTGAATAEPDGLRERRFIYESADFPQCHASTLVETQRGLLAAWFGGTAEGHNDVGIYTARWLDGAWSAPERVAEGVVEGDDRRYPCWNPVLFQPRQGPLLLFYKVGPRPSNWWGMLRTSNDQGRTWSPPRRLPDGYLGPVRAKPIQLADGTIVCGSSTEHAGWQVQMEFTKDPTRDWSRTPPLNRADEWGAIQPTLLQFGPDRLQILCRSRQQAILESWSEDAGKTWSPLARTTLPNPSSGIDAVKLRDGRGLLVYNHTPRGRAVINLAVTRDGRTWAAAMVLERLASGEEGEFSYPAIIQTSNGEVHVTYTWKRRRLRHLVIDPDRLVSKPIVDGRWPD